MVCIIPTLGCNNLTAHTFQLKTTVFRKRPFRRHYQHRSISSLFSWKQKWRQGILQGCTPAAYRSISPAFEQEESELQGILASAQCKQQPRKRRRPPWGLWVWLRALKFLEQFRTRRQWCNGRRKCLAISATRLPWSCSQILVRLYRIKLLCSDWHNYFPSHAAVNLGQLLFPLFALALELPENFFDDKVRSHSEASLYIIIFSSMLLLRLRTRLP